MLSGIGGRTIAEAKERMTYAEALSWFAYIKKHGTLSVTGKLDHVAALLATVINNTGGGKMKYQDFLPTREEETMEFSEAFMLLKSKAKKNG